jgi:hypothetical protein
MRLPRRIILEYSRPGEYFRFWKLIKWKIYIVVGASRMKCGEDMKIRDYPVVDTIPQESLVPVQTSLCELFWTNRHDMLL